LVHGCFWHGHDCRYFRLPYSNTEFWAEKIRRNRERDVRDIRALSALGWRVCVVWECAMRSSAKRNIWPSAIGLLSDWIRGTEPFMELYDKEAMRTETVAVASNTLTPGISSDMELFVAERAPLYSRGNRTVNP
jgi:DNA mismatch endonuclease (patch repair protein)